MTIQSILFQKNDGSEPHTPFPYLSPSVENKAKNY